MFFQYFKGAINWDYQKSHLWDFSTWQYSFGLAEASCGWEHEMLMRWALAVKICQATASFTCARQQELHSLSVDGNVPLALLLSCRRAQKPGSSKSHWNVERPGAHGKLHIAIACHRTAGRTSPSGSLWRSLSLTLISTYTAWQFVRIFLQTESKKIS